MVNIMLPRPNKGSTIQMAGMQLCQPPDVKRFDAPPRKLSPLRCHAPQNVQFDANYRLLSALGSKHVVAPFSYETRHFQKTDHAVSSRFLVDSFVTGPLISLAAQPVSPNLRPLKGKEDFPCPNAV